MRSCRCSRAPRWGKAEQQAARDREQRDKQNGAHVDRCVQEIGLLGWKERREHIRRPEGEQQAANPAAEAEQQAFGQKETNDPRPTGAERKRTAISRSRAIARATSRLATFAQAINSSSATAVIRIAPTI